MFYSDELYLEDLKKINLMSLDFEKLNNKTILITGAPGLIGSFIVDVLMYRNINFNSNIKIIANGLTAESIEKRFTKYLNNENFSYLVQNVMEPLQIDEKIDYVIHAASNAHPKMFKEDPTGTMLGNILGVKNILDFLKDKNNNCRFMYISSGEVYGNALEEMECFDEDYQGYIDLLSARSCYPISKRASETLSVSYKEQFNADIVIARLCHTFGPNVTKEDSRISAQFMNSVLNGEDIILKSKGTQRRSYSYIADTVSGILYVLLNGKSGEAYNVANPNSIVTIREMANIIAEYKNKKVIFELPDENEVKAFNPMDLAVLSSKKLENLGWKPLYDAKTGFNRCMKILDNV